MSPLRVGLIGAGRIANVHAEAYQTIEKAKLVAVADPDSARAGALARRFALDALSDYRELLKRQDVDAVDICTPTFTHEEIAIAALAAGKHVSCQKPFALTLESCDRMIAAARASNKKLVVPYMYRHAPLTVKAKELIYEEFIGRPVNAHHHMMCPITVAMAGWFHEEAKSGGILVDTLTHGVDLFNWYFGTPERVAGFITSSGRRSSEHVPGEDDNAVMMAQYASGVVATLRVTWSAPTTFPIVMTDVVGTEGALRLETPSTAASFFRLSLFSNENVQVWENAGRGHVEKTEYFVRVARGDEALSLSGPEDAREALRVTLAAWQSGRSGQISSL